MYRVVGFLPEVKPRGIRLDFSVNYSDSNTGFHAGWHQDEDHPDLGLAHFQYTTTDSEDRWGVSFEHETPSLILWEIIEELLETVLPTYQQ
ncbi:hypothetical protein C454_11848 [Haloferax gibbonsii ATCC 33959]|uniref:Uncharacterized protein n=1 Tax=Haloferax gibbonsii (strain ATCC 33959 / DSM 4427 / JCM 8863 / NBRC 102184 / NCIMB 2188 / Ma 2.38) TaxID=1227459 RepID=M0H5W8_HALGM|nr:hypothetical protein C454_11848 [Haloferax gibbonsii ATCC 33959]